MRALSQREKWFRPAWWRIDSSGTVASFSSRPRRSRRAADLGAVGGAEDEVAEAEVLEHDVAQLLEEEGRPLQQEVGAEAAGEHLVLGARGVQDDRHVREHPAHVAREVGPGLRVLAAAPRELDVGDDAEHVVAVRGEGVLGLLPRRAQQDLRPRPHPQDLLRDVEPLLDHPLRVVEELGVHHRQERRVVADVVLDEQDHLHADLARVVERVAPVLHRLDDADEDAGVALPQERPLDVRGVVPCVELGELARVPREEDDGRVEALGLHAARELGRVHVREVRRRDDQVHVRLLPGEAQSGLSGRDAGERRRVVEVEVAELAEQAFRQLARLLEDERVVGGGDQQDVHDAVAHQVLVVVQAAADGRDAHRGRAFFSGAQATTHPPRGAPR